MTRICFLRQLEHVGRLVAHAERALRRGVECQLVVAPVRDEAVRLHRRRASAPACDIRASTMTSASCETLLRRRRAAAAEIRHVRVRADCLSAASPARHRHRLLSRLAPSARERRPVRRRCIAASSVVTCGKRSYLDAHELRGSFRPRAAVRRDGCNRLAGVANERIALICFDAWIAQLRDLRGRDRECAQR